MNDHSINMHNVYALRANMTRVCNEISEWLSAHGLSTSGYTVGACEGDKPGYEISHFINSPDLANFEGLRRDFCRFVGARLPVKEVVAISPSRSVDLLDKVHPCATQWRLSIVPDEPSALHLFPSTAYWRGDDFDDLPEYQRAARDELTPGEQELLSRWHPENPYELLANNSQDASE